jgi:hypothetical protein
MMKTTMMMIVLRLHPVMPLESGLVFTALA